MRTGRARTGTKGIGSPSGGGGGGGGGPRPCYEEFREEYPEEGGTRILDAAVQVTPASDFRSVAVRHEYEIAGVEDSSYSCWYYVVPAPPGDLRRLRASNGRYSLQTDAQPVNGGTKTLVTIGYREPIKKGSTAHIMLEYESALRAGRDMDVIPQLFGRQVVALSWWLTYTTTVDAVRASVDVPRGASVVSTRPLVDARHKPLVFELGRLRPKELATFSVTMRAPRRWLGKTVWATILMIVGSGVVGGLISWALTVGL